MSNKFLWFIGLICLAFLTYLILVNATITIQSPVLRSNWTTNMSFNVSWNATDFDWNASTNMTVYINFTGNIWLPLSPANISCGNSSTGIGITNFSCNATLNMSVTFNGTTIPDGFYAINLTIYNDSTKTGAAGLTQYSPLLAGIPVRVAIDKTPPTVTYLSFLKGNLSANGNYSGNITFNISVNDTVSGINAVYFNITNSTGNQTAFLKASRSAGDYWNYSILDTINNSTTIFNAGDGKYNVTVYANQSNTSSAAGWAGVVLALNTNNNTLNYSERVQITIDNTKPNDATVATTICNDNNCSKVIVLNGTANDTRAGASGTSSVYFNITNITGDAAFVKASRVTKDYYNYSFNTSAYADGKYNISIYTNDTAGNSNTTSYLPGNQRTPIIIDNTAPVPSYSCTSTTPQLNEVITCSCSVTDATSGNNATALSYTATPSTSETGTFTISCSAYDNAGNNNNASVTYTVEGIYSGAGGGGGAGAAAAYWSSTIPVSSEQLTAGATKELSTKQRASVKVNNVDHYVGLVALTTTTATINVSSTPQQVTLNTGEEKKFEVTGDTYYDLSVKLNSIANNKANLTLKSIYEAGATPVAPAAEEEEEAAEGEEEEAARGILTSVWFWVIIVIIIIAIIVFIVLKKKQ